MALSEVTVYHCEECGSTFIHDLGSSHVRQTGAGGRCDNPLVPQHFQAQAERLYLVPGTSDDDIAAFVRGGLGGLQGGLQQGDMLVRGSDGEVQVWRQAR